MVPNHIGLILDGNRRWAKREGLSSFDGHKKGIENIRNIVEGCMDHGISVLTCYCFSTENWKRSDAEVNYLMNLFFEYIKKYFDDFKDRNVRLRHVGRKDRLPKTLVKLLDEAEDGTRGNDGLVVNLAINYGGRDEVVRAVKRIIDENKADELSEDLISTYLDTGDYPAPDLIIRTSGEQRLSNFLVWQAAYSEFFFVEKFFPEFSKEDLSNVLDEFEQRGRRFGG